MIDLELWRMRIGVFHTRLVGRSHRRLWKKMRKADDSQTTPLLPTLGAALLALFLLILQVYRLWFRPRPHSFVLMKNTNELSRKMSNGFHLLLTVCFAVVGILLLMSGDVERNPGPPKKEGTKATIPEPTLKDLMTLHITDWYNVGLQLNISDYELNIIRSDQRDQFRACCREMLQLWLHKEQTPSYDRLTEALHAAGETTAATELCHKFGLLAEVQTCDYKVQKRTSIDLYSEHLKEIYRHFSVFSDEWPPRVSEEYINLALVHRDKLVGRYASEFVETTLHGCFDDLKNKKNSIELEDIFKSDEYLISKKVMPEPWPRAKCVTGKVVKKMNILVDGAPGIGKTTLVRKICKEWKEGKMLNEFKLVILLTLRDDTIANSHTLQDLLYHDDESFQNSVIQEIKELSGEGLLLLYDGWDELRSDQKQNDCLLCKIILGKVLPKCSVLVTSRPHASAWLWQLGCISRHIEICGFTEKQIKDCFRKESPGESVRMPREMVIYHDMLSLCYLPLNLAITLYVYKTRNYSFPSSLTEVYELYTLHALIRHFKAHNPNEVVYLPSIKHLPQPERELYSALCRVAFDGLMNKQITFSKEELQAYHPQLPHEHNTLGLMTAFHSFTQVGLSTRYQFTHLTVQEFLAGEKLAGESADFQVDFLFRYISEPQFRMVCIFFSGKAIIEAKVQELFKFFYEYELHSYHNPDRIMLLTHMLYECQNPEILQNVIGGIPNRSLDLSYFSIRKAHDCYIVGDFLKKSAMKWKTLDLENAFSGLYSFSDADSLLPVLTDVLKDAHHSSFEEINLSWNPFSDSALQQFLAIPPLVNLKSVKLDIFRKSESATEVLKILSSLRHLTHLSIFVWKASHVLEVIKTATNDLPLLSSLKVGVYAKRLTVATSDVIISQLMFKLEVFQLERIQLAIPFIKNLSLCIVAGCTIKELELANGLSTNDACTFFQSLQSNASIQILKLSGIRVCGHDRAGELRIVDAFRGVLLANKTLKSMRLGTCNYQIGSRILRQILQGSAESCELTNMEMDIDFIPCREGLICFTEALCNTTICDNSWKDLPNQFTGNSIKLDPRNKVVQRIYLHIHGDDPVTLECITCLLSNAVNLKNLVLGTFSDHNIPHSGKLKILKQMQRNTTVESYHYHYLPNTDSELKTLVETNTTLKRLALYGLNDLLLHSIVERLARHPSLTAISLGCSHFTLSALQNLFQLFHDNATVEDLELYSATLYTQGTTSLAQMLEHNQTLKNLKISSCKFGDDRHTAIKVLVHGLHTNTSLTELSMSNEDRDQILSEVYRINFIRKQSNLPFLHLYWETV